MASLLMLYAEYGAEILRSSHKTDKLTFLIALTLPLQSCSRNVDLYPRPTHVRRGHITVVLRVVSPLTIKRLVQYR
jgi:hypothetical protein